MVANSLAYGYLVTDYHWITNPANGHQYALTLDYSNWTQAEDWAQEIGGHLATINDAYEDNWLASTYQGTFTLTGQHPIVWIGLEYVSGDRSVSSSWQWTSGDPVGYWNPYTPGLAPGGNHMYLETKDSSYPGTWNDNPDHDTDPLIYPRGIIEIPEPATLLLIGIGGLVLRKRRAE